MTTWIKDANGNRCSVEYFGSEKAAQKALDSLLNCQNCTNCSHCLDCSHCSCCSDSYRCSRCSYCLHCSCCSDKKGEKGGFVGPPIPKIENIHSVIYQAASQPGALDMGEWHTCGTTHCRAGWVVHKAGKAGYALEKFYGTELAAQLIYRESDPAHPVGSYRFHETDEEALADMKRMAELEAAR